MPPRQMPSTALSTAHSTAEYCPLFREKAIGVVLTFLTMLFEIIFSFYLATSLPNSPHYESAEVAQ